MRAVSVAAPTAKLHVNDGSGSIVHRCDAPSQDIQDADSRRLLQRERYVARANPCPHPFPDGRVEMGYMELAAVEGERRQLMMGILRRHASLEQRPCLVTTGCRLEIEPAHHILDVAGSNALSFRKDHDRVGKARNFRD